MSSLSDYRTRSRLVVSYDKDFGKVDWEEVEKERVSLEGVTQSREKERYAQEEWKEKLSRKRVKPFLSFSALHVAEEKDKQYKRLLLDRKPTPFVVTLKWNGMKLADWGYFTRVKCEEKKYAIVGYTTKLLDKSPLTKKDLHLETMDKEMFNMFGYAERILEIFPNKILVSDSYTDSQN